MTSLRNAIISVNLAKISLVTLKYADLFLEVPCVSLITLRSSQMGYMALHLLYFKAEICTFG